MKRSATNRHRKGLGMERTKETLEARVRETPLVDRLKECQKRIGNMCAELRGPKMSIPVEYYDDDFYICTTLADAQAMVEALQAQLVTLKRHADLDCGDQSCLYALAHSGMRTNGGCRCSPKRMKDDLERSRKAVEALQRERDKLREATKVICGHCCEPMAIPSKAILQSQLSAHQGLVETIKCELFDRYDGAPDSPTRWMGPLIRDIEIAQALPATPDSYQQGRVAGLREAGPILAKVCEWYEGGTLEQILEEFYAQLKLAQQAQGEKGRA